MTTAREIAQLAHAYLLAERHGPTWAKCRCYGTRSLHEAIETTLPAEALIPREEP